MTNDATDFRDRFRSFLREHAKARGFDLDEAIAAQKTRAAAWARVMALRTNCVTGEEREVTIAIGLRDGTSGKVLAIEEGGVTGYETVYVADFLERRRTLRASGLDDSFAWCACMGTKGRWDRLMVPDASMREVLAKLGVEVG